MKISPKGIELIERYEGFSATPYICPAGKLTIGYGHLIRNGEAFKTVSQKQAEILLQKDLIIASMAVARNILVPLTQSQFDALIDFTFNLGGGRLQSSTLRQKLNRRDYTGAAEEFKKWVWGGGKKLPGLIRRRADEKALFLSEVENAPQYVILPWLTTNRR